MCCPYNYRLLQVQRKYLLVQYPRELKNNLLECIAIIYPRKLDRDTA